MLDCVVIGGGTAGMTAAIYLLRAGKSAMILESTALGGQITASERIENFPGLLGVSGIEYADKLAEQVFHFGGMIDPVQVAGIERNEGHFVVRTTDDETYDAKSVIIATGAAHRHLGLLREESLPGVSYCAVCDGAFYKGKEVLVVGGGNSAVQSALSLAALCKKVTLIHRRDGFRAEPVLMERMRSTENIEIRTGGVIKELQGEEKLSGVVADFGGNLEELSADGLFIAIGQKPENEAFANFVDLDEDGYIEADETCITKTPGIFAAGDCRKKAVRQLVTAAGDGAAAGLAAIRYLEN